MSIWNFFPRRSQDKLSPAKEPKKSFDLVEDYLPQAVEDQTIIDMFQDVHEHLENHLTYFYKRSTARAQQQTLISEDTASPQPAEDLTNPLRTASGALKSETLQGEATPQTDVDLTSPGKLLYFSDDNTLRRHVQKIIAQRLIAGIQPFADDPSAGSLLPMVISNFLPRIPDPVRVQDDQVYLSALGRWRNLTWYLLRHKSKKRENDVDWEADLKKETENTIRNLDTELESFLDGFEEDKRRADLGQLVRKVADLGLLLLSQVAQYEFEGSISTEDEQDSGPHSTQSRTRQHSRSRYTANRRRHSKREPTEYEAATRVVFPGIIKISDHHGNKLATAKWLCEPQQIKLLRRRQRTNSPVPEEER